MEITITLLVCLLTSLLCVRELLQDHGFGVAPKEDLVASPLALIGGVR